MNRSQSGGIAVIVLASAGLLAGCSEGSVNHKTMTQAEATARVLQILHETVADLTPKPTLGEYQPDPPPNQCLDDVPDTSRKINAGDTACLYGIPQDKFGAVGRQGSNYWKKQGYYIQAAGGFDRGRPDITVATKDSFLVSLDWSAKNLLSIGASSPCIYPDGTPQP